LVTRIEALTRALKGSDIDELDLTEQGTRIVIRRRLEPVAGAIPVAVTSSKPASNGAGARPRVDRPPVAPDSSVAIITPLTGVFYAAASPSSPPYVQAGSTVQAGQIVCIVEAMKVFNEIRSEVAGTVLSIQAQAGQLVHKGEPLMRVEPA
jgi:acetyl-CoA carboxylase biotin carboxyl carrier protein